jgi:hypothetical protein
MPENLVSAVYTLGTRQVELALSTVQCPLTLAPLTDLRAWSRLDVICYFGRLVQPGKTHGRRCRRLALLEGSTIKDPSIGMVWNEQKLRPKVD